MFLSSVIMKVPRFFHFRLNDEGTDYATTDMMEDTMYTWTNAYWDDLMVTGFLPLIILVYFNVRIYLTVSKNKLVMSVMLSEKT